MAVPKRKTSKTRKALRRTGIKLAKVTLVACPNCGEMILPHKCGFYDGRKVK